MMRIHPLFCNITFNSPSTFTCEKMSELKDMAGFFLMLLSPPGENLSLILVRKSHCRGLSEWRSVAEKQHDLSQHTVLKMSLFLCIYRCFCLDEGLCHVFFANSGSVFSENSHVHLPWQGCHIQLGRKYTRSIFSRKIPFKFKIN